MTETVSRPGTQYAIIKGLCYPETNPSIDTHVDTYSRRTRKIAETDGRNLKKLNKEKFEKADSESRFVIILHEVTHYGDGIQMGRGSSSHSPSFWEEFQENFNKLRRGEQARTVVEALFDDFDWHRAKYRAVQRVTQVDNRSETRDERQSKMAEALEYDNYEQFEDSDWGFYWGGRDDSVAPDESAAILHTGTKRYADEFSDEELLSFVDEYDGCVPMPLAVLDIDEYRDDGPQHVYNDNEWDLFFNCRLESRKALAVQERLGHGYTVLCAEVVQCSSSKCDWDGSSPVDPINIEVASEKIPESLRGGSEEVEV